MTRFRTAEFLARVMRDSDTKSPALDDTRYGETEIIDLSSGRKVPVGYMDGEVWYFVPSDAAWTAGVGAIEIERAYRILKGDADKITARKVDSSSELESVAAGYTLMISISLSKK